MGVVREDCRAHGLGGGMLWVVVDGEGWWGWMMIRMVGG